MKEIISFFTISIILLTSCTHVRIIENNKSSYKKLNERIEEKKALITLTNDEFINGQDVKVNLDSTSWIESKSQSMQIVPTSEVYKISIQKRSKGALEGFGLGFLFGACMGVLAGFMEGDDPSEWDFSFTAEGKALVYGIFFGGIGGLLGLPIGATIGGKYEYVFIAFQTDSSLNKVDEKQER